MQNILSDDERKRENRRCILLGVPLIGAFIVGFVLYMGGVI